MYLYTKQILKVLVYIEEHIDDDLTMGELAKVAAYSMFHFHRIFQAVVGETVHKYIKRLRLERAAGRLRYTDEPVTEIALEASFDTPSSFAKAFRACMGSSPRKYRILYQELHKRRDYMEKLNMIQPDKIAIMKDVPVLFIRGVGEYAVSSQSAWDAMLAFIQKEHLDKRHLRYFSISHDDPNITDENKLRFDACITLPEKTFSEIGKQMIKGGKYAVFTHKGSHETIGQTYDRIFLKWLPDAKEEFDESRPTFCEHFHLEYVDKDPTRLVTAIYIPLA